MAAAQNQRLESPLMIELLCTLTGIIAGVAVVASLLQLRGERLSTQYRDESDETLRMQGIAEQLQQISSRVAANVTAHNETVENINDRLTDPDAVPEQLMASIHEIISANKAMQERLADAQQRINQQSHLIEQASKQARTDALTGLANRRALDEYLGKALRQLEEKAGQTIGLLIMDIDHFKSFNDTHGHTTGDAVLAGFARAIASICDDNCFPARFGGEEFCVVLRCKNDMEAIRRAAKIRRFVSSQTITYEEMALNVTASAGLYLLMPDDELSVAYERADEGLYMSKEAGRNCGHWLGPDGSAPFPEEKPPAEVQSKVAQTNSNDSSPRNSGPESSAEVPAVTESEVLELTPFLERLDASMEQLRRAELPATAIMVEALQMSGENAAETAAGWDRFVDVIEHSFRGIDIVCRFRPHTLCIFIPGCSEDAAIERATRIQASFQDARRNWNLPACPKRLAISISQIGPKESATPFLNRLEKALDEAVDADDGEVVVHTGASSHFLHVE